MRRYAIVAADVNNDGMVDIIIGNDGDANQVLAMAALMMQWIFLMVAATADMNNDGMVDILVENEDRVNQVEMINGDGSFGDPIYLLSGGLS